MREIQISGLNNRLAPVIKAIKAEKGITGRITQTDAVLYCIAVAEKALKVVAKLTPSNANPDGAAHLPAKRTATANRARDGDGV